MRVLSSKDSISKLTNSFDILYLLNKKQIYKIGELANSNLLAIIALEEERNQITLLHIIADLTDSSKTHLLDLNPCQIGVFSIDCLEETDFDSISINELNLSRDLKNKLNDFGIATVQELIGYPLWSIYHTDTMDDYAFIDLIQQLFKIQQNPNKFVKFQKSVNRSIRENTDSTEEVENIFDLMSCVPEDLKKYINDIAAQKYVTSNKTTEIEENGREKTGIDYSEYMPEDLKNIITAITNTSQPSIEFEHKTDDNAQLQNEEMFDLSQCVPKELRGSIELISKQEPDKLNSNQQVINEENADNTERKFEYSNDSFNKFTGKTGEQKDPSSSNGLRNEQIIQEDMSGDNETDFDISRGILKDFKSEPDLSDSIRNDVERYYGKNYIDLNRHLIFKTQKDIIDYLIKSRCVETTKFSDFIHMYDTFLNDYKNDIRNSELNFLNGMNQNDFSDNRSILWNPNSTFRYYEINHYNFDELIKELNLEKYINLVISLRKPFQEQTVIMEKYDLRDEYELYDLLKKIWAMYSSQLFIQFEQSPIVEIGNADIKKQIENLLIQSAPISMLEFASKFERLFVIQSETCINSYFDCINHYLHGSLYVIDKLKSNEELHNSDKQQNSDELKINDAKINDIKERLSKDYYSYSELLDIFREIIPDCTMDSINKYTVCLLGFKGYSSFVIRKTYHQLNDYFMKILDGREIFTLDDPDISNLVKNSRFMNYLHNTVTQLNYIEFMPRQYISTKRLTNNNVTKEDLNAYRKKANQLVDRGEYITLKSIRERGLISKLDELGMDDRFYESIIESDDLNFSGITFSGCRIIKKGIRPSFTEFIFNVVDEIESIDIYDLQDMLLEKYGMNISIERLIEGIRRSNLYYDKIMEKAYRDYDTYYKEI